MSSFDEGNEDHIRIAELAREVAAEARGIIDSDEYLSDPSRSLPARRLKLRKALAKVESFQELEALCAAALGTTAFGDEVAEGEEDSDNE